MIASDFFHGKERYNCAQAVLRFMRDEFNVSQETIDSHSLNGGGRAEGGVCGALFAARVLLADQPKLLEELNRTFVGKSGSERCREIRSTRTLSCTECVNLAGETVSNMLARK